MDEHMYRLTGVNIPVCIACKVCSSSELSPVNCWYLPQFNFIFFLAPLMSTHTFNKAKSSVIN